MKTIKIIVLLVAILTASCSTEGNTDETLQQTPTIQSFNSKTNDPILIIKLEMKLGKPSSNECEGFGICTWPTIYIGCVDAEGNEIPCDTGQSTQVTPNGNQTVTTTVFYSDQKGFYFDLAFDIPVNGYEHEDLQLHIEEEYNINTEEILGHNLIIQAGKYQYNESIGKYGGVRVPLQY